MAVREHARRDHRLAQATRSGGDNALFSISAEWGEAERTEREAAAVMTSAERIVDRSARARDSVDAATPPPPARVQHVHSRSGGFQACYTVVPSPSTHQPTYAVPNPFTHHMSPTYLSTHVPVLIPEVCDQIMV